MHGDDPEDQGRWPWPSTTSAPATPDAASVDGPASVELIPADVDHGAESSPPTDHGPVEMPSGWTDLLTSTDGPQLWDRVLLSEGARVRRYRRPVTVAFADVDGLEALAHQWGWEIAIRALTACARVLAHEIRSSDHLARVDLTRFGILLTETAEIAAINFVERARASCEAELRQYGDLVAIRFGWASPPQKGDLTDAVELARARVDEDRSPA